MFMLSSRQCHCVHKCNTMGLSSFCIAPVSVPKVEVGERAAVPIIELGEQRVNFYNFLVSISPHQTKVAMLRYMESLTDVMDPADFSNSAETRLAVSRVISWIKEAKSPEIKRVSGGEVQLCQDGRGVGQIESWMGVGCPISPDKASYLKGYLMDQEAKSPEIKRVSGVGRLCQDGMGWGCVESW